MLLKIGKASEYCGIHPNTLRKYIDSGEIKAIRIGNGKQRHIYIAELDAWLKKRNIVNEIDISEANKAYIAGFFDGEGSINIHKKADNKHGHPQHWLEVTITNTNKEVLDRIHYLIGFGTVSSTRENCPNRKDAWVYRVRTQEAKLFLHTIFDYLIVKQKEAVVVMEFQSAMRIGKPLTKKEVEKRDATKTYLQSLR